MTATGPVWNFRNSRRAMVAFIAFATIAAAPGAVCAIEVQEVLWGFDGRVVMDRFNPLSVLLANPSRDAFDGWLELNQLSAGSVVDAPVRDEVYVGPGERRWVQLYPYVMQQRGEWRLTWGRGAGRAEDRHDLEQPPSAAPVTIAIGGADSLLARRGTIKRFPEHLFPPTVTATDGLDAVALDHVPRWEAARQTALVDWVHRGGTLHLFQENGRWPEFGGELAVLNSPLDRLRLGAGTVIRHESEVGDAGRALGEAVAPSGPGANQGAESQPADTWDRDVSEPFFGALKGMTRPDHNWGLIHLLSLLYLLLLFPGCYMLGGKRSDYRVVFGAVMGLVVAFSSAFSHVGRRGYEEATAAHSVAVARPLADGHYDVTAWSNAFVTDGAVYAIEHAGTGRLYSTCQVFERVRPFVRNGPDGALVVDIPPFSSRTFGHRAKVRGKPLAPRVLAARATGDGLRDLAIDPGENFLQEASQLYAVHGNKLYSLAIRDGRLLSTGPPQPLQTAIQSNQLDQWQYYGRYGYGYSENAGASQMFPRLLHPLMARSLGITNPGEAARFSFPEGRLRLFVYAPMAEEFRSTTPELGRHEGWVLYCFDLDLPEAP